MNRLLLSFLLFPCICLAQKQNYSSVKQAQKSYLLAKEHLTYQLYDKAILELNQAISKDENFTAAYQQLGDIYRISKNYKSALINYSKVLSLDSDFSTLSYYGIAEAELHTGDYTKAIEHFNIFLAYPGLSDQIKQKASKYIVDCTFSIEAIKSPVSFKPFNLGPQINSEGEDYLPVITADEQTLIFTRKINGNEDFYKSNKNDSLWSKAQYLSDNINTPLYNEGAQSITPDGNYLFFTGCNRPDGLGRCDIYLSKWEGKAWSNPVNLGGPINTSGWESQPSISADGRTLYFVSNRKGGYGGYDLWKSELNTDGSWNIPENLGPEINTKYDEQSPFIHPDDESIYFSSDGWPGLGSKDLFMSKKISENGKQIAWQKVKNLGFPINTFGEESGLTVSNNGKTAFFSSNQPGGFGGLDIYSFELPSAIKPNLVTYVKGLVFDENTKEVLNAKVEIISLKDKKIVFEDYSNPENGEFLATMVAGKPFGLNVFKEDYLFYSQNYNPEIGLTKKPYLIEIPMKKIEIGASVILHNIFFDPGQYDLLPESKSELVQLLHFLMENPKISIEISGHTDDVGDKKFNLELSENRARTVYNYLLSNGVSVNRITAKGYGEAFPILDNLTEVNRKNNRRTSFKIITK